MSKRPHDPDAPLDPIEALVHIRAIIEASADGAYGTKAEPMVREIRNILDRVLPPQRRARPTKQ